jgi:hypothetical protein
VRCGVTRTAISRFSPTRVSETISTPGAGSAVGSAGPETTSAPARYGKSTGRLPRDET